MNYKELIEQFESVACVLSVERLPDGSCGEVRVMAGNEGYVKSLEMFDCTFYPGMSYTEYTDKDANFEDFCLRCAFMKQPLHAYVDTEYLGLWMNLFLLPMHSEEENIGYCLFAYEMSQSVDTEKLTDISANTALYVLKTCIKLKGDDDFQTAMNAVIRDIRSFCQASSCCILLTDYEKRTCSLLAEDFKADREKPEVDFTEEGFFHIVETWPDILAGSNCFIIKNENDMKLAAERDPVWVESLREAEVDSVVLFSLRANNKTVGYIWAANFDTEKALMIKETLELTSYLISAEISNYQLICQLEEMNCTDLLTGVRNRNAMNHRMNDFISGSCRGESGYGVVFADLNGLKRVNDTKGHIAGDTLLKDAAALRRDVFSEHEIYRAGGDEFLVIVTGEEKESFDALAAQLKERSKKSKTVSFAVGSCYALEKGEFRNVMQLADERMYQDKKEFYQEHSGMKRRGDFS